MLTTVLDLVGYAALTVGALVLFGAGVGLVVAGVCVLVISWKLA